MKIVFLGKYNQTEILTGPEKVAKRLFHEIQKSCEACLFIEYFFKREGKSSIWKRLFGKEVVGDSVLRLGVVRIFFFLLKAQPDVIHIVTFERFIILTLLYKILLKAEVITTLHGVIKHELKLSLQKRTWLGNTKDLLLEFLVLKISDRFICVSEFQLGILKQYYNIDSNKACIIPNGIDEVFLSSSKKEKPSKNINIVMRDRSGFEIDNINTVLEILMEGKIQRLNVFTITNKEVIQSKNEHGHIYYVPQMSAEQLVQFLQDKHLVINAAAYDTFSLFAVECMAAGVVPIVADTVGIKSYIKHAENGFVFNISKLESLKTIIEEIAIGRYNYQYLSENAKQIYKELAWSTIAKQYRELYLNG